MTRGHKNKNQTYDLVHAKNHAPSNKVARDSDTVPTNSQKEHNGKSPNSFDIIQ